MRLNGWQRLWALISILFFIATGVVLTAMWPTKDTSVLANIHSPACKMWLQVPEGFVPDNPPNTPNDSCYELQSFLFVQKLNIRGEADYDMYLLRARIKAVAVSLGVWFTMCLLIYLFGWSVGWVIKGFRGAE